MTNKVIITDLFLKAPKSTHINVPVWSIFQIVINENILLSLEGNITLYFLQYYLGKTML